MSQESQLDPQRPIVFFDGECGLCNGTVDWLLKIDRRGDLLFAPIQGQTAKEKLPELESDPAQWSIYYLDENGLKARSRAVVAIMSRVGAPWSALRWIKLIPRPLRDFFYRVIAHNRYKWFGKRETCRRPEPHERDRFLD